MGALTTRYEQGRWAAYGTILERRSTAGSGDWVRVGGLKPISLTVEVEGSPTALDVRIFATSAKDPVNPVVHPGALVHEPIVAEGAYNVGGSHLWVRAEVVNPDGAEIEVNVFAG